MVINMKRKLYRFVLKMILKDQEIDLTGKQKSQVESLIKKM